LVAKPSVETTLTAVDDRVPWVLSRRWWKWEGGVISGMT
jgi:hypothetical protein